MMMMMSSGGIDLYLASFLSASFGIHVFPSRSRTCIWLNTGSSIVALAIFPNPMWSIIGVVCNIYITTSASHLLLFVVLLVTYKKVLLFVIGSLLDSAFLFETAPYSVYPDGASLFFLFGLITDVFH